MGGCPRRAPSPPATLARATGCGRSRPLPPAAVPGSAVPSPARRPSGRSGGGSAPRAAARDEPEEMTYLLCEPSASPRPCPAAAGPGRPPPPPPPPRCRGAAGRGAGAACGREGAVQKEARRSEGIAGPRRSPSYGHAGTAGPSPGPGGVTPQSLRSAPGRHSK